MARGSRSGDRDAEFGIRDPGLGYQVAEKLVGNVMLSNAKHPCISETPKPEPRIPRPDYPEGVGLLIAES